MRVLRSIPVDEIKHKVPLPTYIEKHYNIPLKRSGLVYKAICPFHEENTGSFVIFKNNTYKCFGCGEHGDIITFVEKMENIDFKGACKMIAENENIEYTLEPPNPYHENYKDLMTNHCKRYFNNLRNNKAALDYLINDRKLTAKTISKFGLGYVPLDEYKNRTDIGGISGRISFPIFEDKAFKNAKCIGMGYRTLKNEKPKYINDKNKDDPKSNLYGVFIKGNCLYGYNYAEEAIRKNGYAIITEGYMDVISLHQSGIINSVGILGTSFTEAQTKKLRNITENILLFLDGDNAGVSNMIRILPMLLKEGFNVKMIIAKNNKDAADICKDNKFNTKKIKDYIYNNSKNAVEYILGLICSDYNDIVITEKRKALKKGIDLISNITNNIDKKLYLSSLYKRLDI